MPCSQKTKTERDNIVTNSIKTLKGVHIKKKKRKPDKKELSEKGVKTQSFFEYKMVVPLFRVLPV